jgi:hypothetical protein
MDENVRIQLTQLLRAVQSLGKAVEKSIAMGSTDGIGDMTLKSYRNLHERIAALLPDDYYVTEVLKLDVAADAEDAQKVAQVHLAIDQLVSYLENMLRGESVAFTGDLQDLKDMGRELQASIITITRKALKRALANIDIDVDIDLKDRDVPEPPEPPKPSTPPTPPASSTPIV